MSAYNRYRFGHVAGMVILGCVVAVLSCTTKTIQHVVPVMHTPALEFIAGAGKAEITPPAGYPFFGYSLESKSLAFGFQSRLYARAFYLESAEGDAVALVQCDLGAISGMLHHEVARRVAKSTGLGPDRILIAATHTHSAPGAYFGSSLYNDFGSKEVGFDDGLFDYLGEQIASAIDSAYAHRASAVAAVGTCEIDGITYNRSLAACLANFPELQGSEPADVLHAVNKTFTMLRVDQVTNDGTVPLGAFTNFAIHGTCIGGDNDLYNGDCHAAAERYFEEAIRNTPEGRRSSVIVHAITNGMEGDVAPKFDRTQRGFEEAERIGLVIADSAFALYQVLEDSLTADFTIQHAYREISMRHATHSDSAELAVATSGFPVMGGTEDGYTPMHYLWPGAEGSQAKSADMTIGPVGISALLGPFSWRGQDSAKIPGASGLHNYILSPEAFPSMMTLQAIRLGDLLLLAVPGEMTTEMGRRIVKRCELFARDSLGVNHTMIVTLANQYMSYITTEEEYNEQHYEGAHTLWGPQMGLFVRDQFAGLIREIPSAKAYSHPDEWTFSPRESG